MASFDSFTPPSVYGLLPSQHHGAQFEEPVPTDDEDSGYGSDDYDFARPSPIDALGFGEGIIRHDLSALSLRQRPPRCAPLIRHITPFTRPDHDFRSGSDLADENSSHLHNHKHRSRLPADLLPLSNRVQSDTNNSSSTTPPHFTSPNPHPPPKNPSTTSLRSSTPPARKFAASNHTPDHDLCNFHDRYLTAEWQKLYQESRKLERQRAALMARLDIGRVPYRQDLTDRRWAVGIRDMSVSDGGMGSEIGVDTAERAERHGCGRKVSRANRSGAWFGE